MPRIRGEKKRQEKDDHNAPLHSPRASSINPSSVSESDWWENFSARFSGYTPDSLFKVSRKTFEYICGLVEEEMTTGQNYSDQRREYLALNDRVAIALTRLCTGESFEAVGNLFGVNISTAYQITWRFVEAIEKKGFHHLHWPKTEEKIMEIKSKFEGIRGLPNCCGAIDTTKIMFSLASDHAQRKIWCDQENNPCTILQAVVDPDMRFLDIMAGLPGCVSEPDALCEWSLFNLCEEGKRLNGKKLKLAESNKEIGEYIVGNGGFPLLPWLLTPYNEKKKPSDAQQDFNKRLYETMKVAKMAFERLKETWKIIQGVVWRPDKLRLPRIIYACCVLHNIMIDHNDGFILQDESLLQSNDDTSQAHQPKCKFLDKTASVQRDNLALYLSSKPPPFSGNGSESVSLMDLARKNTGKKGKGPSGSSIGMSTGSPVPSAHASGDSEKSISRADHPHTGPKTSVGPSSGAEEVVDQGHPFVDLDPEGQEVVPLSSIPFTSVVGAIPRGSSALPPHGKKRKHVYADPCGFTGKEDLSEFIGKFSDAGKQIWNAFRLDSCDLSELQKEVSQLRATEKKQLADLALMKGTVDSAAASLEVVKEEKDRLSAELEDLKLQFYALKISDAQKDKALEEKDKAMEEHLQVCKSENARLQDLVTAAVKSDEEAVLAYKRSQLCIKQVAAITQPMLWQGYISGVQEMEDHGGNRDLLPSKTWLSYNAEAIANQRFSEYAAGLDVSTYVGGDEDDSPTPP